MSVRAEGGAGPGGDWPHTTRILPWMLAGFLAMLWLVPVDATTLPVSLPFGSYIDRFALAALIVAWLAVAAAAGRYGPSWRRNPINVAVFAFLLVATVSVVLNAGAVARAEEWQLALKSLSKVFAFAAFFLFVASVLRKRELPRFGLLIVGLACLTAIGTIIEYRTGTNYFFDLARKIPGVQIGAIPPSPHSGRPLITGPTQHGLAAATMLAMALPFAVMWLLETKNGIQRLLPALAIGLIFAGAVATLRKTGLVAPLAALIPLIFYRRRQLAKLLPVSALLLVLVLAVAPGALQGIDSQVSGSDRLAGDSQLSIQGRTADYAAVTPDILHRPLLGRGYGTYDPNSYKTKQIPTRHRQLDNQYLTLAVETGIVGVVAFLALGIVGFGSLRQAARSPDSAHAGPAVAISGAIAAFFVSSALFDTMAFVQVPYLLFFFLGIGVVAAAEPSPADVRVHTIVAIIDRMLWRIRNSLDPPRSGPETTA